MTAENGSNPQPEGEKTFDERLDEVLVDGAQWAKDSIEAEGFERTNPGDSSLQDRPTPSKADALRKRFGKLEDNQ